MKQTLILAALVASASAFAPASVMPKPATALKAGDWEKDWKETNFEADIKKLEKEAEERLEAKIEELKANIASTGVEN